VAECVWVLLALGLALMGLATFAHVAGLRNSPTALRVSRLLPRWVLRLFVLERLARPAEPESSGFLPRLERGAVLPLVVFFAMAAVALIGILVYCLIVYLGDSLR
jgi:hypothetical protein